MKNLLTRVAGTLPLGLSGLASAQGGTMMNGGMGGAGWMGGPGEVGAIDIPGDS
jgi:hypothetical protein